MSLLAKFKPPTQYTQNTQNSALPWPDPPPSTSRIINIADIADIADIAHEIFHAQIRRCAHCEHWTQKPYSCWWVGICGKNGHRVDIKEPCQIQD